MASIRQMPRGTWQAIVRRNGHRPQFRTFEIKQDAKQWARLIESEIDRAVSLDRGPRSGRLSQNSLTATSRQSSR